MAQQSHQVCALKYMHSEQGNPGYIFSSGWRTARLEKIALLEQSPSECWYAWNRVCKIKIVGIIGIEIKNTTW